MKNLAFAFEEKGMPQWPVLANLAMSIDALTERKCFIGGSDANIILSGSNERILNLWLVKRGQRADDDLSNSLPVVLGQWTEAFNRQWYQQMTDQAVDDVGMIAVSEHQPWRRATLDGFVASKASVWEAKHTNAFAKSEEILTRYMPQLQHNMAVLGVENSILSVIYGNHKWECYEIAADWLYQDELLQAEIDFWDCVRTGREPCAAPPAPLPCPDAKREICFDGNNAWAAAAADWLTTVEAAKVHASASKAIKELVEADVRRAFGHGIEVTRSRARALSIKSLTR